jgi:hypothetical protein
VENINVGKKQYAFKRGGKLETDSIIDSILTHLEHIEELPYRLIIIVAPSGSGKTAILQELSRKINYPLVNVNLLLGARLKELTKSQHSLRVDRILTEILDKIGNPAVILDNIEILFDINLKISPLSLLQKISRNRTVIASWNGSIDGNRLIYAQPGHAEYGNYELEDVIAIRLG